MRSSSTTSSAPLRGRAILCFPPHASWFQGYFFPSSPPSSTLDASISASAPPLLQRQQFGLLGTELPVDACVMCPDGGFQRFHVVVSDFQTQREAHLDVTKRGGELCRLESEDADDDAETAAASTANHSHSHVHTESEGGGARLRFQPQVLLTDTRAVEAIRTYFPSIASTAASDEELADCAVCMGEMTTQGLAFHASNDELE